jgi:hypothetical protein
MAFALLYFFRSGNPATRISEERRPGSIENAALEAISINDVFRPFADHLTLRVNPIELASLEPSLLTINRALPEFEQADRVLPLDLPIRKIRLDVEAIRTP